MLELLNEQIMNNRILLIQILIQEQKPVTASAKSCTKFCRHLKSISNCPSRLTLGCYDMCLS